MKVEQRRYAGEIHGFFNLVGLRGTARDAVDEMCDALRAALA